MNILKSINNPVNHFFGYIAKVRTVAELNQLSDRQLADIGFSRGHLDAEVAAVLINNTAKTVEPVKAKVKVVQKPVKAPKFDLGAKLASMYSSHSHNPTGHVV